MKQQDWISVEDDLPVSTIRVLAISSEEKQYIAWVGTAGTCWLTKDKMFHGWQGERITHWMNLPPGPSRKKIKNNQ